MTRLTVIISIVVSCPIPSRIRFAICLKGIIKDLKNFYAILTK